MLFLWLIFGCIAQLHAVCAQISENPRQLHGVFVGVPEDARLAAEMNSVSSVVNGLNYQSRIDVRLNSLGPDGFGALIPVEKDYVFRFPALENGEYELMVDSYDFTLANSHFRVIVADEQLEVFKDSLVAKSYNASSRHVVSPTTPLNIQVVGYKEYYESSSGKLSDMVMKSPLGFVFKNKYYTAFFGLGSLLIIAPYVLSWISPDFAEELKQQQQTPEQREKEELMAQAQRQKEKMETQKVEDKVPKEVKGKARRRR